ncbi:glutamate ABC transporter substrate-binding protein [Nocardioides rotundus]|uniref:glutamate ABC transporter substrate-binding protein n=1 Tax=Nocardioides rotundus TaxID=1774216 RepID=UPI001CBEF8D7|nr:glutamate ABC transporter substrate-binding protein [Nocardioides rotundus]UAL30800.1 glutamate ABC transporter substrate-binding protein [Nocardioides rotundus]
MRVRSTVAAMATTGLMLALAACGDAGGGSAGDGPDVEVKEDAASQFDDGTKMKELADAGKIKVGVKYDQPGLGYKDAASDVPTGFDIEMAKILVASLGIDPEDTSKVEWVETISDNREPFLQDGTVDLVLATYSITDERRQLVGQAGPYMVTGQQLLVPADSDVESTEDLQGKRVCAASGSTSLENIEAEGMKGVPLDSYTDCVDRLMSGGVDAVSTDGSILAGLAAENEGELKVVGEPFSEERIGVGYNKDNPEMCQWIVDTLTQANEDGQWAEAFESTLGPSGVETPEFPEMDSCES